MKLGPERIIQCQAVHWLKEKHPAIIVIANFSEQDCHIIYRKLANKMGYYKGQSDLFFPESRIGYKGMWIEVKAPKGRPSKEQIDFQFEMRMLGYDTAFTYGYDELESRIKFYFSL